MFATNPEWWKEIYMADADEKGQVIVTPTTAEEFRQMAEDWGLAPEDIAELELDQ